MEKNYFGITDTGKIRDNNEDTFIAGNTAADGLIIACVIDGVGGYSGGEIASAIARQSILDHLEGQEHDVSERMKAAIISADQQINTEKKKVKEHENMACVLTLAVADLNKNQFYYAHVGDTRLYLLRDNSLVKISKDQSFVGFMEDSGRLTEEQAMRHPKRNEINKALGFGANIIAQEDYIETGQSPFLPGDLLLLCSDGLSDMVNRQDITTILTTEGNLQQKGKQLIEAANANGGKDNITVVLVKNNNQPLTHEATRPATAAKILEKPIDRKSPDLPAPPSPTVVHQQLPAQRLPPAKSNKFLLTLLSVLCTLLLAFCVYLLWKIGKQTNNVAQQKLATVILPANPQETRLQDTLNKLTGDTLILTDSLFKTPLILTESLQFNRDTLVMIAKGNLVISPDSGFKGAAISIKPITKYVLLENITFENFNTAISSQDNALVLKNVLFNNCPNTIQTIYRLPPAKFVNGKIAKSTLKADSLSTLIND